MREFRVMSKPLKQQDLETFGEPFVPEFVYEVIRNTKSFAHMRVSPFDIPHLPEPVDTIF